MFVLLSYYSDGSSEPELQFIPDSSSRTTETFKALAFAGGMYKKVRLWEIHSTSASPTEIFLERDDGENEGQSIEKGDDRHD